MDYPMNQIIINDLNTDYMMLRNGSYMMIGRSNIYASSYHEAILMAMNLIKQEQSLFELLLKEYPNIE